MNQKLRFKIVPNQMIGKLEVVLYSHEQKCYHIEPIIDYLKENVEDFITSDSWNGYQVVGIFNNYEDASDYIVKLREIKENETVNTIK